MAEVSSGNEDKNVSRTGSFKLFGKSPSRNLSKKNSNPIKRIFSKKKSEKQGIPEDETDSSVSNEAETEKIEDEAPSVVEKIGNVIPKVVKEEASKILQEALDVVPKLTKEVVQEESKINVAVEPKEVTIEPKEVTPDFENSAPEKQGISNDAETEMMADEAPNVMEKIEEKASKILQEASEVVPKLIQEAVQYVSKINVAVEPKEVTIAPKEVTPDFENSSPATEEQNYESLVNKLKEERERIDVELHAKAKESGLEGIYNAIIAQTHSVTSDDQLLDDNENKERSVKVDEVKEKNKEENCVASLAQGLQKICAPWNSKTDD